VDGEAFFLLALHLVHLDSSYAPASLPPRTFIHRLKGAVEGIVHVWRTTTGTLSSKERKLSPEGPSDPARRPVPDVISRYSIRYTSR